MTDHPVTQRITAVEGELYDIGHRLDRPDNERLRPVEHARDVARRLELHAELGELLRTPIPSMFAIGAADWPGLSKLSEEAGEVVQVIGKLMGTGGVAHHWDGTNLADRLIEEMADVAAAIEFVLDNNNALDRADFARRKVAKEVVFRRWHAEQSSP